MSALGRKRTFAARQAHAAHIALGKLLNTHSPPTIQRIATFTQRPFTSIGAVCARSMRALRLIRYAGNPMIHRNIVTTLHAPADILSRPPVSLTLPILCPVASTYTQTAE